MTGRVLPDGRWLLELEGRRITAPEAVARRWLLEGPPPEVALYLAARPRRLVSRLQLTLVPAPLVAWAGGLLAPATAWPTLALAGLGGAAAVATTAAVPPAPSSWWTVPAWILGLGLIHELGHAAGLCRGGGRPGAVGVGWAWVLPVLWCDVSEVGVLSRHDRLRTDLAGPAWQLGAAGVAAGLGVALDWGTPLAAARAAALAAGISLLPLRRNDGGWALADALDLPSLDTPLPEAAHDHRRRAACAIRILAAVTPPLLLAAALWRLRPHLGILWNGPPALDLTLGTAAAGGLLVAGILTLRRSAALIVVAVRPIRRRSPSDPRACTPWWRCWTGG